MKTYKNTYRYKNEKILLFDNSALMHVLKHSTDIKRLKKNEIHSYIIFNYLFRLQFLVNKIKPTVCVFARDSRESKRKKIFPDYKGKRKEANKKPEQIKLDEIAYPQFSEIEENLLPMMGFSNIFQSNGFEADDIVASVCKNNPNADICIITTDEDMYQLLTNTVSIFNARKNKYFTKFDFTKKYGIEPNDWKKVKAASGCTSDNVPGIKGVGEKTIIKYLRGELPAHHKTYKEIKDPNHFEMIMRNKRLVILPFEGTPIYKIEEDDVTVDKLKKIAHKYNFIAIKNDLTHWKKVFSYK